MRSKIAMIAALALVAMPIASLAASSTLNTSVPVAGAVEENCTISSSQGLGFGPYDAQVNLNLDLASNQSGKIAVQCSVGSSYNLSPPSGARFMVGPNAGGTDHLNYTYQIDQGGGPFNATSSGENYTISGKVTHGQNVHHGTYQDPGGITVTVALNTTP